MGQEVDRLAEQRPDIGHLEGQLQHAVIGILKAVIDHAKAKGSCWFATHDQAARWCKSHALA